MDWRNLVAASGSDDATTLWGQLWALECAYWDDVDFNHGEQAPQFYTEDGLFDIGVTGSRMKGQEAIARFYKNRKALGTRTTLHLVANFTLVEWSTEWARTRSIMSLYGADGPAPRKSAPAIMTAVSANAYVRTRERQWRVSERVFAPYFTDDEGLPLQRIRDQSSP
ncbi:nuclear transport factor 2 family protein [Nocardia arthritidis]|uniref:nuclear transport factor 2 family protein n=1 Tax=Nocardia arthritidis TaxID=228602 RepID=UPI0007A4CC11|nr:nuclear transport factor 2 family protein [Nocardia arthritidis]